MAFCSAPFLAVCLLRYARIVFCSKRCGIFYARSLKGPLVQRGLREAVGDCDLAHKSAYLVRSQSLSQLRRATRVRVGPFCRCATSPHTVGSHPLHKGGFAVGCRGEHCSPAAISGNVKFHGSIWNAPLRRRGGFYIRPCNLGQRKTARAHTVRPYKSFSTV